MMGCRKCQGICAIVFLVLGLLYLGKDYGYAGWWNVSWYSALFLWVGLASFGMRSCADCQSCCGMPMKKGKK